MKSFQREAFKQDRSFDDDTPAGLTTPTVPTGPSAGVPSIAAVVSASEITSTDDVLLQEVRKAQVEAQPRSVGPRGRVMLW